LLVFEVDETDTEVFRETVVCPSAVSEHVSAERVARHLVDVQQVRDTVTTEDLGVRSEASYAERDSRADQVVIFGDCIDIERPREVDVLRTLNRIQRPSASNWTQRRKRTSTKTAGPSIP